MFSTTFEGIGFEINPYDSFFAKKSIEGTQFTIAWYVDDNKLSHKIPAVISNMINKVKKHFGGLSIVRGGGLLRGEH